MCSVKNQHEGHRLRTLFPLPRDFLLLNAGDHPRLAINVRLLELLGSEPQPVAFAGFSSSIDEPSLS